MPRTVRIMSPCRRVSMPETADQVRCQAKIKKSPAHGTRALYEDRSLRAIFSAQTARRVKTAHPARYVHTYGARPIRNPMESRAVQRGAVEPAECSPSRNDHSPCSARLRAYVK